MEGSLSELPDFVQLGRTLLAYTMWADRHHLDVLAGIAEEHLTVPTGSSFGSLLGTMAHILGSEQVWMSRFMGAPIERPNESDWADLAAVRAGFEELWPSMEFFLAALNAEQLDSELAWISRGGNPYQARLWQALVHMSHHGAYHRGQITTMLRQLGYDARATDLIKYYASQ